MLETVVPAPFFVSGGTVPPEAASYVVRDADRALLDALRAGRYCYVLTSRQMGKSSLCVRTMEALRAEGVRTAFVDLTRVGGRNVTAEQWYAGLLGEVGRGLGDRAAMLAHWKAHPEVGPMQRFFGALREVGLAEGYHPSPSQEEGSLSPRPPLQDEPLGEGEGRIVVFIDEIDATRSLGFSTDEFFAGIRECFNRRVQDPLFERLTFCLIGVAIPSDLMSDAKLTPFNVGERIVLRDFTLEEAMGLARGLEGDGRALIERIVHWTGGHPFLTQSLGRRLAETTPTLPSPSRERDALRATDVDRLVADELFEARARETNVNLADVGNRVLNAYDDPEAVVKYRADVLSLYERVLKGRRVADDESNRLVAVLKLAGIVKVDEGRLRVRNRIYAKVFGPAWVKENMPLQEKRRQQRAFRKGALRTGAFAAAMLAVVGSLAVVATRNANLATANARRTNRALAVAKAERVRADRLAAEATAERDRATRSEGRATAAAALARAREKETATALAEAKVQKNRADGQAALAQQNEAVAKGQKARADAAAREALGSAAIAKAQKERADTQALIAKSQSYEAYASGVYSASLAVKSGRADLAKPILRSLRSSAWRGWQYDHLSARVGAQVVVGDGPSARLASGAISGLAFVSDGTGVIASRVDGRVEICDLRGGSRVSSNAVVAQKGGPQSVAPTPDGRCAAVVQADGSVALVELTTGRTRWISPGPSEVSKVAVSPDGKEVVVCGLTFFGRWRVENGSILGKTTHGDRDQASVVWSPTGGRWATCGTQGDIRIFEGDTIRASISAPGVKGAIAFSTDGQHLATGSDDGTVSVYNFPKSEADADKWEKVQSWNTGAPVLALASSPPANKGLWAAGCGDGAIRLYNQEDGVILGTLSGSHPGGAAAVAFSPDGRLLASGGADSRIRFQRLARLKLSTEVVDRYPTSSNALAVTRDGRSLVSVNDQRAFMMDPETGKRRWTSEVEGWYLGVALSPDGRLVAASNYSNGLVDILDGATGRKVGQAEGQYMPAFSPDGRTLVVGGEGAGIYDARTWALRKRVATDQKVVGVAFAPDGKTFAIASQYQGVERRRVVDGSLVRRYPGTTGAIRVAFSADGRRLAAAGPGGTFAWDVVSGKAAVASASASGAVAFTNDGSRIVASSLDGSGQALVTFDVASGRGLASVAMPDGGVTNLQFDAAGNLYASLFEGTVRVYRPLDAAGYASLAARERASDAEALKAQRETSRALEAAFKDREREKKGELLDEIKTRLARRDWTGALPTLDRLLKTYPDLYASRLDRATALATLGRYAAAESDLRQIVAASKGIHVEREKYQVALAVAARGDTNEYLKLRRALLAEPDAGRTTEAPRVLLLVGAYPVDLLPSEREVLAKAVADPPPGKPEEAYAWTAYSALALLRLDRPQEALQRADRLKTMAGTPEPLAVIGRLAAVLASARLGEEERARTEWDALQPPLRKLDAAPELWSLMLPIRIFRKEVETTLGGKTVPASRSANLPVPVSRTAVQGARPGRSRHVEALGTLVPSLGLAFYLRRRMLS